MSIIIENMSFCYDDNKILDNINLFVSTGGNIGIIGQSGCGKSTLLKLIAGLYSPQSGKIIVEGQSNPIEIRKKIALVTQNALLFPSTIKENITCGHAMDMQVIMHACEAAQIIDWIKTLPNGINTFVGERNNKVSGGEAQRISIARAIAKDAPAILLDEATSALDEKTEKAVLIALENLTKGKTVLQVSHKKGTLKMCDKIYYIDKGYLHDKRAK